MAPVIELSGLAKVYGRGQRRKAAVDGLDLVVPEGGVFGFLGPNGSGKTTTIRCLLGLVRPTAGELRLVGRRVPGGLAEAMRSVGAIVETPALFPTMTGYENLRLLAAVDGIGKSRVRAVLDDVGLGDRAGEPVRRYSLGMRQRLALAAALMKEPALLVLDEPANGLDPAGIRQLRELMRSLGRAGHTVFLSSHILSEVEQTCDRVAILNCGRCVASGTVADVLATAGPRGLRVRVDDLAAGEAALAGAGLAVRRVDDHLAVDLPVDRAGFVTELLAAERLWVTQLQPDEQTLEDLFLSLTGEPAASAVLEEVAL